MKWSKEHEIELEMLLNKGMSSPDLAKRFNRHISSIHNKLKNMGRRSMYKNVDANFFERDDEVSNYILGYWLADGYISNRGGGHYFSIASIDFDHLDHIKKLMKIKTNYSISNNCYIMVVGSKELYYNMINLGCSPRKTHTITFHDISYNAKYFYDFLRGYFDGDGSMAVGARKNSKTGDKVFTNLKFTGSKSIIFSLHEILSKEYKCTLREDKRGDKNNCWYLDLGAESSRILLYKMYGNPHVISLKRKFDIYTKYVSNHPQITQYKLIT